MKKRNKMLFLAFTVIISIAIFYFFVTGYYSIDTLRIYRQGYTDYAIKDAYVRDGRFISALIFSFIGIINPTIKIMYIINIIIAIFILSICVSKIYDIIQRYKNLEKKKDKIIAYLISYTYIFNFLIVDILQYIDSFVIATSILLFITAIKKIIIEKKVKIGFIYTLIGIICYQGTVPIYIATALLVTLLENKQINKQYFKKILPAAISIIIVSLINIFIVYSVPSITGMDVTDRIDNEDIIIKLNQNLKSGVTIIFYSFNMFPPYMWIAISLFIIVISIIWGIKKNNINFPINMLFIFMVYILSFMIFIPIQLFLIAPRVALTLGQVISAMLIYSYCNNFKNEKMNWYEIIIIITILIYFVITIISIIYSTHEYKLGNLIDKQFADNLQNKIVELQEQGIKIDKVGIRYSLKGENIEKYSKLTSENCYFVTGYTMGIYEFYTGEIFSSVQDFTKEFEEKNFEKSNTDEIQYKSLDNTLYVLINL